MPPAEAILATEHEDTIAACATPPGTAGIAVVRLSGRSSIATARRHFSGSHDLEKVDSHTVHFGTFISEDGVMLDEVLVTVFRSPHSYTGEDCVEISCHGGAMVSRSILQCLCRNEVRHALPGEFTKRAFLNGKIDLAQAEAIADLIHAQSGDAHRSSVQQLQGKLSAYVETIRTSLLHCASMLELALDFAEEDVDLITPEQLIDDLNKAHGLMQNALDTFRSGRVIREGVKTVLVGEPNVGKSSLLNLLLGTRRAIVTDIPGTTRDYLEEALLLEGRMFRFIDTAGLHSTADAAELQGIAWSEEHIRTADIVCVILDATVAASQDRIDFPVAITGEVIRVLNKIDILADDQRAHWRKTHPEVVPISAATGEGLPELIRALVLRADALTQDSRVEDILVTNARHADCLRKSQAAIARSLGAIRAQRTEEFIAYELREAIAALDEIIGAVTTDDILHTIFSRFCIGK